MYKIKIHIGDRFKTEISLEMKPDNLDGLILYANQRTNKMGDFLSLLLVNGSLVFTYSLGSEEQVNLRVALPQTFF